MAKIVENANITMTLTFTVTEAEARALEALAKYDSKQFLEFFYQQMGKTYLQPHEKGLISLFESINQNIPQYLKRVDNARALFHKSE